MISFFRRILECEMKSKWIRSIVILIKLELHIFLLIIIFVCNYITFPRAFLVITREKRYLNGTIPFTPITLSLSISIPLSFLPFATCKTSNNTKVSWTTFLQIYFCCLVLESFILQFVSIKFFKRNLVKTTIYDTIKKNDINRCTIHKIHN